MLIKSDVWDFDLFYSFEPVSTILALKSNVAINSITPLLFVCFVSFYQNRLGKIKKTD